MISACDFCKVCRSAAVFSFWCLPVRFASQLPEAAARESLHFYFVF
ncbi:hypothetical protein [Methanimicrococcus hongohii]|nr:hypothetical protein [Methanimicrococcus sp. Hf6]